MFGVCSAAAPRSSPCDSPKTCRISSRRGGRNLATVAGPRCNMLWREKYDAPRSQACFAPKRMGELSPADAGGWASPRADMDSGRERSGLCRSLPTAGSRGRRERSGGRRDHALRRQRLSVALNGDAPRAIRNVARPFEQRFRANPSAAPSPPPFAPAQGQGRHPRAADEIAEAQTAVKTGRALILRLDDERERFWYRYSARGSPRLRPARLPSPGEESADRPPDGRPTLLAKPDVSGGV